MQYEVPKALLVKIQTSLFVVLKLMVRGDARFKITLDISNDCILFQIIIIFI